ncbi:MAG: vWA domain-containing protein [Polyangiaceae bacterium]
MIHYRGVSAWAVVCALGGCSTPPDQSLIFGSGGGPGAQAAGGSSGGQGTGGLMLSFGGASQSGGSQGQGGTAGAAMDASGGRTVTSNCAATMVSATDVTSVQPADIVFAIDSSGSMDQEIVFVRTYMNDFSRQISNSGIDVRVILIADEKAVCIGAPLGSGKCPADTNLPGYVHVAQKVDSHNALNLFISTFPKWKQYLRPNASKSLVVITDDDATTKPYTTAKAFTTDLSALDTTLFAKYTVNGVYCFTKCPEAANIGTVYSDLVQSTQGVGGDLCLQDFQPVFDRLAKQIITTSSSQIACEWSFPSVPTGQTFSGNLVEVRRTDANGSSTLSRVHTATQCASGGWYLDNNLNPTKIVACPSTCSSIQNQSSGKIDVTFGCESVGSCVATGSSTLGNGGQACEWALPSPPSGQALDTANVNVRYTSQAGFATDLGRVPNGADCAQYEDGWYFDDPNNPKKILACSQTCTQIQSGGSSAKVDVLFGCKSAPADVVR